MWRIDYQLPLVEAVETYWMESKCGESDNSYNHDPQLVSIARAAGEISDRNKKIMDLAWTIIDESDVVQSRAHRGSDDALLFLA